MSISPAHAVKEIFSFPANVVSLFGVRQADAAKFVVNALFWSIEGIVSYLSDQIIAFRISILRF